LPERWSKKAIITLRANGLLDGRAEQLGGAYLVE